MLSGVCYIATERLFFFSPSLFRKLMDLNILAIPRYFLCDCILVCKIDLFVGAGMGAVNTVQGAGPAVDLI